MSIFDSLKALFGQGDTAALPGLLSEGLGKYKPRRLAGAGEQITGGWPRNAGSVMAWRRPKPAGHARSPEDRSAG